MEHKVEEIELKNGAKGLLIDVPAARIVDMRFGFRAGNRFVRDKSKYETAHLMEHMAFGANARFKDEQDYEADFTKNGAYHNAFTADFAMTYVASCADFEWERIFDLQKLAIAKPKFNEDEMMSEKGNITNELTGYKNNYGRLIWQHMQKDLGEDILILDESLKTLPNISLKDICNHHALTHTAKNMRFLIAGNIGDKRALVIEKMENFGLRLGERLELPKDEYVAAPARLIQRKDAANLSFGFSMMVTRRFNFTENLAMDALNHILTGTLYSRIFGKARKLGLVYGVMSEVNSGDNYSAWDFGGEVNYEAAKQLFQIVRDEILGILASWISDEEIEAFKSYAYGRYLMGGQTVAALAESYVGNYFNYDEVNLRSDLPERLQKIRKEDLVKLAREFVASGIWTLTGVGNKDDVRVAELYKVLEGIFV
ncbi:MAG: insulinase family protein [Candidatus Nomurabacteria bacterium]|jgi:predicted Zn-dependent peptidase|nr:insulinase family protein [Candidatus Nomurabacteria bacterium]